MRRITATYRLTRKLHVCIIVNHGSVQEFCSKIIYFKNNIVHPNIGIWLWFSKQPVVLDGHTSWINTQIYYFTYYSALLPEHNLMK